MTWVVSRKGSEDEHTGKKTALLNSRDEGLHDQTHDLSPTIRTEINLSARHNQGFPRIRSGTWPAEIGRAMTNASTRKARGSFWKEDSVELETPARCPASKEVGAHIFCLKFSETLQCEGCRSLHRHHRQSVSHYGFSGAWRPMSQLVACRTGRSNAALA
jgi:hypothetical protein